MSELTPEQNPQVYALQNKLLDLGKDGLNTPEGQEIAAQIKVIIQSEQQIDWKAKAIELESQLMDAVKRLNDCKDGIKVAVDLLHESECLRLHYERGYKRQELAAHLSALLAKPSTVEGE